MPEAVLAALIDRGVVDDYRARAAYQRNDYLGWIERAKRPVTRSTRIAQMLDELECGGVDMRMEHPPSTTG